MRSHPCHAGAEEDEEQEEASLDTGWEAAPHVDVSTIFRPTVGDLQACSRAVCAALCVDVRGQNHN
ncbi:hypothetical protein EYF80_027684 [Liparis tanakae]|uniref:Uncharacterized protein n=1 Tax=Liparis tanakae TaxID=230148 RepID=A0A4Z2HBC9_9TELE|nr:hypothetical protein EYF80_027684 [Liparis tanakae]